MTVGLAVSTRKRLEGLSTKTGLLKMVTDNTQNTVSGVGGYMSCGVAGIIVSGIQGRFQTQFANTRGTELASENT
jgi:hypothetical protein